MYDRSFDARFQEMAEREKANEKRFSGLKVAAIQALSIVVGFVFVSVLFSVGVALINIGLGLGMSVFDTFITGAGLSVLQAAHAAVTWARK